MNKFDPNDPKWTAYLLGELAPEETKECDKELKQHPEAEAFLQGLIDVTTLLQKGFDQDQELELAPGQKERIEKAISPQKNRIPLVAWVLPLAAVLVVALMLPVLSPSRSHSLDRTETESPENPNSLPMDLDDSNMATPPAMEESTKQDVRQRPWAQPEAMHISKESSPSLSVAKPEERSVERDQLRPSSSRLSQTMPQTPPPIRRNLGAGLGADAFGYSNAPAGHEEPSVPFISPSQDEFDVLDANTFRRVSDHPLSTFSIDVDTASYSVVRKMLKEGRLPPKDAVRIEEMVNYFKYDYAPPKDGSPFAAHMRVVPCPWAPEHQLVRVALKGKEISAEERPALNLVYLLDVSGSMSGGNRLPLVKRAMKTLVSQLDERDRVAIVVYAGAAGLVLPSTSGENDNAIIEALDRLNAGGSTAGGAGIQLAYETAREQYIEGGVNRVILCTDGDFNVGLNQTGDLQTLIEKEAKSGVQLTVLGFGMGNYKDDTLETLSNKGNGNYAYIDDYQEARKVLVDDLLGNMITIAKDVKIQVEFNPTYVAAYRLVGYENRMLKKEDFNNDKVDAGEIGAGHTVTALYELVPAGTDVPGQVPYVDELKYQKPALAAPENDVELLTLKLRHKHPDEDVSVKTEFPLPALSRHLAAPREDVRFATAVAAFGFWLRDPEFRDDMTLQEILELAQSGKGEDPFGYRAEFIQLVRSAEGLAN